MKTQANTRQRGRDGIELSVIVPTLNEAAHIRQLLNSLQSQYTNSFEVIIVDGGSQDGTTKIAKSLGARVYVREGAREFEARNYAAARSKGSLLLFSCADVLFPPTALSSILQHFETDANLVALTGPDFPYDGGAKLRATYNLYNGLRLLFSRLPRPLKAFSTSTNFLVVRRENFEESGGFETNDVNADGIMGRYLANHHRTLFDKDAIVYISARRASNWGFSRFTRHYLYVIENFVPSISRYQWFQRLKIESGRKHGEIHDESRSTN